MIVRGRRRTIHALRPNDKKEKHQLTAGNIETSQMGQGQLQSPLPPGIKARSVFVAVPETKQLTVTTSLEGGLVDGGHPSRFVMTRTKGPDAAS
jgi:hypothetical protein